MAGRRNSRRSRRGRRNLQKRRPANRRGGVSLVTVTAQCARTFSFFCPKYSQKLGASVKSWLQNLVSYGTIALKIFTYIIAVLDSSGLAVDTHVITSAVQSVFIGVEDLLFASPLSEREIIPYGDKKVQVPCIDFKSARMPHATVTVTPGSALKDRSGRYAAVILPITEEEYATYIPNNENINELFPVDEFEFQDIIQMPGCKVAPFGRAMTLRWRANPYTYANRFLMIGQTTYFIKVPTTNIIGGKPSFRLIVGFQDFANTEGDTVSLYSASNALIHVDVRARIQLTEPVKALSGRRYIRDWPKVTQDAERVTATTANGDKLHFPLSEMYVENGYLRHSSSVEPSDEDQASPGLSSSFCNLNLPG